jgi:hypothetical protein
MMQLLFYLTLFVLGLGLHFVGSIFVLAALGDDADGLARWYAKLGLVSVFKPVVTVNASNELTLKRRQYDEGLDNEKVTFGGLGSSVTRYLRDPQDRLHRFLGVRFGFVEERTGLVFDPRDADAAGESKRLEEDGSLTFEGTATGNRVPEYVRGVLELPSGARGVNLQDVYYLVGGSAKSQMVDWLIELYSRSQEPRESQLSFWQKMTPIAALVVMLLLGAFISGNMGGGGGGGGGGGVTLPVGGALLAMASTRVPDWVTRERVVAAGVALVAVAICLIMFTLFPAGVAFWALVSLGIGLVTIPAVAMFLGRSLGGLGIALGQLYLILACFAFDQPVIHLREDDTYTLTEYSDLGDDVSDPSWYRFAKAWVGVTYDNSPDAWPGRKSTITQKDIQNMSLHDDATAGLPGNASTTPALQSGGHRGVVPQELDGDTVGVSTRHAFSWFRDVGRGRLLQRALKNAKEDHFGGNTTGDDTILKATIGFAFLGLLVDVFVFF